MNYYSASVALLWTTAMRCAAPAIETRNGTSSGRPVVPLAKSRCAWVRRTTPALHTPGSRSP
jgi:hypothetical protein